MSLNGFLDPYIERARPIVERAGGTAEGYARHILTALHDIRSEIVRSRQPSEYRMFDRLVPAAAVVGGALVADVPMGEVWKLEAFTVNSITNDIRVQMNVDGKPRITLVPPAGTFQTTSHQPVAPIRVVGPSRITVHSLFGSDWNVYLQFEVVQKNPRPRRTLYAGQQEAGIAAFDGQREHSALHMGISDPR